MGTGRYKTVKIMYFTSLEKQAIYHFLVHMSLVDNDVDSKEVLLTVLICNKLNISESDRMLSEKLSPNSALEIISNMTSIEKDFVCSALGAMIAIDNNVNPKEMILWNLISNLCGFPEMNVFQAQEKFQKYIENI